MLRAAIIGLLATVGLAPVAQAAQTSPLIGAWRVTSGHITTVGVPGDKTQPKIGYLIFTPEHRMVAIVADPDRKPATNDAEALALSRSIVAYTGKFDLTPDHYTIHVEFSSTMLQLDRPQVRYYKIDGDKLTITVPEAESMVTPGVRTSTTLTLVRDR